MLILYGSETGTAEELAERVARIALASETSEARLMCMNDCSLAELQRVQRAIFICSTTGNGEPPRNMRVFWRQLLQRNLPANLLSHLQFALFGLGDSSYEKFCVVGKRLFRRLLSLGASPLVERADGDEQHPHGLDGAFLPWLTALWPDWRSLPLRPKMPLSGEAQREASFSSQILFNQRVTAASHWQDVRLIGFNTPVPYEPGDVVQLVPENDPEEVQKVLLLLQLKGDAEVNASVRVPSHLPPLPPGGVSLQYLLTSWLDLNRPPSRRFLEIVALKAQGLDEQHRERLLELGTSPEHYDDYLDYVVRPKRKASEVLSDLLTSIAISTDWIFDLFPWIRPRLFSIASHQADRIELLVAMVQYRTMLKEERKGLCSQWLKRCSSVTFSLIPGAMRLPTDPQTSILMLCAGTGLAPMRSMLQAIARYEQPPPVCLFFGHRSKQADFLCQAELESYPWLRLISHGSRDQKEKVYLQHLIRQHADLVIDLIASGCYIYVAGNSKLPQAVKAALGECLDRTFIDQLEVEGRLQIEAWS